MRTPHARPLVVPATVVRCAKDPDHPGRVVDERREEGVACENASFLGEFQAPFLLAWLHRPLLTAPTAEIE